jgi:hypothetical protein
MILPRIEELLRESTTVCTSGSSGMKRSNDFMLNEGFIQYLRNLHGLDFIGFHD